MFYYTRNPAILFDALEANDHALMERCLSEKNFYIFQAYNPNSIGNHNMRLLEWALLTSRDNSIVSLIKRYGGKTRFNEQALISLPMVIDEISRPFIGLMKSEYAEVRTCQESEKNKTKTLQSLLESDSYEDFSFRIRQGEQPSNYLFFISFHIRSLELSDILFLTAPPNILTIKNGLNQTLQEQEFQRLALQLGAVLRDITAGRWSINDDFIASIQKNKPQDIHSMRQCFDENVKLYPAVYRQYVTQFRNNIDHLMAKHKSAALHFIDEYQSLDDRQRQLFHAIQNSDLAELDALTPLPWRPGLYQDNIPSMLDQPLLLGKTPQEIANSLGKETVSGLLRSKSNPEPSMVVDEQQRDLSSRQREMISV